MQFITVYYSVITGRDSKGLDFSLPTKYMDYADYSFNFLICSIEVFVT